MPLDAICTTALCAELEQAVVGGRIDKVQQPERDMILLSLRANGKNRRLLIAAGTWLAALPFLRPGLAEIGKSLLAGLIFGGGTLLLSLPV